MAKQNKIRNKQPEYELQKAVAKYLDLYNFKGEKVLYCASMGGVRTTMRQAIKMKETGYKRGFPDLFIYEPNNKYNGLAIELKTKLGYPSKHQKDWINKLSKRGYYACVCKGLDSTISTIKSYFSNQL